MGWLCSANLTRYFTKLCIFRYCNSTDQYVRKKREPVNYLTLIGPCIANIFAQYNQQDATFHNLFMSLRRSKCFRRVFRPSSGAQNCAYSVRYLSDRYCYTLLDWLATGDVQLHCYQPSWLDVCCLSTWISEYNIVTIWIKYYFWLRSKPVTLC